MDLKSKTLALFSDDLHESREAHYLSFAKAWCADLDPWSEEALLRTAEMLEPAPLDKSSQQVMAEMGEYQKLKLKALEYNPGYTLGFTKYVSNEQALESFAQQWCKQERWLWSRKSLKTCIHLHEYWTQDSDGDSFDNMGEYGRMMKMKRFDDEWEP